VGTREIRKFNFGVEVCFDHANGALKGKNPNADFHVVVSDYVDTNETNMAMGNGGYFIHASSNPNQSCVYKRNTMGALQKLTKTAGKFAENQMAYWLIDVEKRKWDKPEIAKPSGTNVNVGGKVLTGAKKVM
jgi:hypothetical protein